MLIHFSGVIMGATKSQSLLARAFRKAKRKVKYIQRRYIQRDVFKAEVRRWKEDEGDDTLRLSYGLNASSVVVDLGGYVGDFAMAIHKRYQPTIYLFEPSSKFYDMCVTRFAATPNIMSFNFGLSDTDGEFHLSDEDDGSSISNSKGTGELVKVRKFQDVYDEIGIDEIDLLKINIEGGEYDVIPHLIETGLIKKVRNLQVQFHNFIPDAERKRNEIVKALQQTHKRDWCYIFVWESWSLK